MDRNPCHMRFHVNKFACTLFKVISLQLRIFSVTNKASVEEPVELKLFEIRSLSQNYIFNKYLLQSVWRMLG